jgi:hypothetical protein
MDCYNFNVSRLRELAMVERSVPVPPPPVASTSSSRWAHSGAAGSELVSPSRYEEPPTRRSVAKRPTEHRGADPYYEERPSKRSAASVQSSATNERRGSGAGGGYDVPQTAPPPPRFGSGPR